MGPGSQWVPRCSRVVLRDPVPNHHHGTPPTSQAPRMKREMAQSGSNPPLRGLTCVLPSAKLRSTCVCACVDVWIPRVRQRKGIETQPGKATKGEHLAALQRSTAPFHWSCQSPALAAVAASHLSGPGATRHYASPRTPRAWDDVQTKRQKCKSEKRRLKKEKKT